MPRSEDGRSAFAEALDAMERQFGEPERDSRVTRARQTRPTTPSGTAVEASNPQTVTGQPVQEPASAIQAVKTGAEGTEAPAKTAAGDEAAATDKTEPVVATDAKPADAPQAPVAVVPTPTPAPMAQQPATGKAEGEAVVEASATTAAAPAAQAAATPAPTDPAAAQAAAAQAAADGSAEAQAAAQAAATTPAETTPTDAQAKTAEAAPKTADAAQQRPTEQVQPVAEARPRTEGSEKASKAEQPTTHRSEAAASASTAERKEPQVQADATPHATPDTPAQTQATPAPAGPSSFGMEVAQKVAAQTASAGSPVPVHALAVTIAARASQGATRFDIRLDPAELGRIDVQLTVDRDGHVKSKLVVEKQETLDLLQRDQRNLERVLTQAGVQTSEGSLEFSLKDQGGQSTRDQQQEPRSTRQQVVIEDPETIAALQASASTYARAAALRGGVDIRI
ncbi:flagellar hook-length control protein FliK [Phreatobacter oligotrophus]|uniref:Chemotaxis protein MotD n=1 Tax=Phreatobacter oligotrophus TaxID=1122261 RepID=A0A2T4Z378_9HYPH|nr:flagellar hook-length control protein FliK [Phreatobacter oligotrophus]PTM55225.1 chemotaxis protein MotD [Phreatobacter oligotrophus]